MTSDERIQELKTKLGKTVKTIDILKVKLDNALERIAELQDYIKNSLKN